MVYTIGQVAKKFQLSISTLRYYDNEGLLPTLKKNEHGVRIFDQDSLSTLYTIECLKKTGMSLKDIKIFMSWCVEGDRTLEQRRDMFYERRETVLKQIQELQATLDYIDYKCHYYEQAVQLGSEKAAAQSCPHSANYQQHYLKEEE